MVLALQSRARIGSSLLWVVRVIVVVSCTAQLSLESNELEHEAQVRSDPVALVLDE